MGCVHAGSWGAWLLTRPHEGLGGSFHCPAPHFVHLRMDVIVPRPLGGLAAATLLDRDSWAESIPRLNTAPGLRGGIAASGTPVAVGPWKGSCHLCEVGMRTPSSTDVESIQ